MTYTQMKMLINFIKVAIQLARVEPDRWQEHELLKSNEAWLLRSCGYERKF